MVEAAEYRVLQRGHLVVLAMRAVKMMAEATVGEEAVVEMQQVGPGVQ